MSEQEQFLDVIDRDEAERRFWDALQPGPLGEECISLQAALGRVLSRDVRSPVDVPSFDRSNFDGFALRAEDTWGADEQHPKQFRLLEPAVAPGMRPTVIIRPGTAVPIATGGMLPRGADSVLMIEQADVVDNTLLVRRAITPGFGVTYTGTDISAGELLLRRGEKLTSRETGVLAAVGFDLIWVWRRPRVALISTGDELLPPGQPIHAGAVYDSNQRILADAVREIGCEPIELGIVPDNVEQLQCCVDCALAESDAVLLSGGTSKGQGDLSYRVVYSLRNPGVVVHGVALKPGKPLCLAVSQGKPVVVLPGFPTSAVFTFHEFVAPVLRCMAGLARERRTVLSARLAVKINSEIGRTEYVLVGLVPNADLNAEPPWLAFPMGKGSGSVTAFSRADGFLTIARHEEMVQRDTVVPVTLLAKELQPADLIVIGSHCVGLDLLLSRLQDEGIRCKFLPVGSMGGLEAARRGQCDVAGIHLMDPESGCYNRPFVTQELEWIPGYGRTQGFVFRSDDSRFVGLDARIAFERAVADPDCVMINRNAGSGTRLLLDKLLGGRRPVGYAVQAHNHNGVAAAVAQGRADWGIAIYPAAIQYTLGFLPLQDEQFDFVIPRHRLRRPAVVRFCEVLQSVDFRQALERLQLAFPTASGSGPPPAPSRA